MGRDLYSWQVHPKNRLIRVRYAAHGVVEFEFRHPRGVKLVDFGEREGDWLVQVPHCEPGTTWVPWRTSIREGDEENFAYETRYYKKVWSIK